ncbi:protein D3 isoform X2 [Bemisia tabaci]
MTDEVEDIKFTPGPTYATVSAALIKETLTKTQIIPDALDKAPGHNANIMWYDLPMGFGKTLAPLHVKYFPTWFQWPHDPNKLYTFVMTDLDYPTKKSPSGREFLIWLIGNIGGDEAMAGKECVDYVGWQDTLKQDRDLHRYIVTVFEQPEKFPINFTATNYLQSEGAIQNRTKFSTRKFATSYKLGDPIAVDFAFVNVSGPTE